MTTTKQKVLSTLQQTSTFVSGQTLSTHLGLSRNAIWKAINALKEDGYNIHSHPRLGYQLIDSPHTLNYDKLALAFQQADVFVYDTIHSTNTQAKLYADTFTKELALFVSNEQTQGRGRFGKTFHSPKGKGVYFTILLKNKQALQHLSLITPLAAVSVYQAILTLFGKKLGIKWVNDLFYNNKKVVGILAETAMNIELNTIDSILIGIGINLYKQDHLPHELQHIVGYLFNEPVDVNTLVITIVEDLLHRLNQLPDQSFMQIYKNNCFLLGKNITVSQQNGEHYQAKAIDIAPNGQLIVQLASNEIKSLQFGTVSTQLDEGDF